MKCHRDCRCNFGEDRADVSWVTPTLGVGGMVHPWDIEELKEMGVTHILSVNWPDRPEYPEVITAFTHLDLPTLDDAKPKPAEWFQAGVDFAATLGPTDKLLVHCGHGINRSPAMATVILRAQGHADAEAMVRGVRRQMGGDTVQIYLRSAEAVLA